MSAFVCAPLESAFAAHAIRFNNGSVHREWANPAVFRTRAAVCPAKTANRSVVNSSQRDLADALVTATEIYEDGGEFRCSVRLAGRVLQAERQIPLRTSPHSIMLRTQAYSIARKIDSLAVQGEHLIAYSYAIEMIGLAMARFVERHEHQMDSKNSQLYIKENHPAICEKFEALVQCGLGQRLSHATKEILDLLYADLGGTMQYGETPRVPWDDPMSFFT
jgi:hypothetical protein